MTVSIIVPVYNRKDLIKKCVESLLAQTLKEDYEIILIDDGSTDGTKNILKLFSDNEKVSVLYNDNNSGPSYSRNRGIKSSKGKFIALIDSDCAAETDWLEQIIHPFQDPAIMITTGKVSEEKSSNYWQLVNKGENFIQAHSGFVGQAVGCNMALQRDFAMRNAFDEKIKKAAGEETDLCFCCIREGNKIFYTALAQVTHCHRATIFSTLKQQFEYGYYNTYIRIKHQKYPYLNYGTWILLAAFFLLVYGNLFHQGILVRLADCLLVIYMGLVLYINIRPKDKNLALALFSYPGFLAKCLSNCGGNIFWLLRRPLKLLGFPLLIE